MYVLPCFPFHYHLGVDTPCAGNLSDFDPELRMLLLATLSASTIRSALSISRPTTTRIITMAASSKSSFRNPHNLPVKTCVVCNKPFTWRKKWERDWDEIQTCSQRCNSERKKSNRIVASVERGTEFADDSGASSSDERCGGSKKTKKGGRSGRGARMQVEAPDETNALPVVAPVAAASELLEELSVIAVDPSDDDEDGPELQAEEGELDPRAARKAAKKAAKAQRRARREGEDTGGQKSCDLCARGVDLLVRCQIDESKKWVMTCGKCWKTPKVAGGVVDGDGQNPHYRYGGVWKNHHRATQ